MNQKEGNSVLVDMDTSYIQGIWMKKERSEIITQKMLEKEIQVFGALSQFITQNGLKFQNEKTNIKRFGIKLRNILGESTWSNGKNKKRVGQLWHKNSLRMIGKGGGALLTSSDKVWEKS